MIAIVLSLTLTALLGAFVAVGEAVLVTLNRSDARRWLGGGATRARSARVWFDSPQRLLAALMILRAGAYVAAGGCAAMLAAQWRGDRLLVALAVALLFVFLLLLTVQVTARALAMRHLETTAAHLGPWVRYAAVVLSPFIRLLSALEHAVLGGAQTATLDDVLVGDEGLQLLLQTGEEPGIIEVDEKEMIAGIIELGETVVREVMVPRIDVVAVPETIALPDALDLIITAGHSRIPVYRGTIDNVQGVLYAKDLLRPYREGRFDVPIKELLRPAYFVPESKKIDELLRELQQSKVHMAIVVDEYGGTAGVVTIEDLLEEIVGDIQDEYDSEDPMVTRTTENEYSFDARISLDEVSKLVGVDLPTEESDTLGGFIFSQLGRVPTAGSQVVFGPLTFEVQSISGRRIQKVRVVRQPELVSAPEEIDADMRKPLSVFSSMF